MKMIEFEEGAVCYAVGHQWKEGDILPSDNGSAVKAHLPTFLKSSDFQLNEPREGWHIPKSELDTEEKYNKAVEVFGLFGFGLNKYHKGYYEFVKVWRGIEIYHGELASTNATDGTKCTYTQLMAIGELKRKMLEREGVNFVEESGSLEVSNSSDIVKNPKHYQFFDGVEAIEIIARSMTKEQFKGYCMGNKLKYRLRAGEKDSTQQEIDKSNFYGELYDAHKDKCRN